MTVFLYTWDNRKEDYVKRRKNLTSGQIELILKKNKVELIGAKASAISRAEDRALFRKAMREINLDLPKSEILNSIKNLKVKK